MATGLSFALCLTAQASADIAPPPDDDDDDSVIGLCLPDKEPGDDCKTPEGEEGTCGEETKACVINNQTRQCYVCEESCSVAAVGTRSAGRTGAAGIALLVVLALYRWRRRERR